MATTPPTLDHLRRYAIARSLFKPTTLPRAIEKLGFVQADPIRAPARAQDLTLRHRVRGYRAGELERRYPRLAHRGGFLRQLRLPAARHAGADASAQARTAWTAARWKQAQAVLDFVRERGAVHPREVDAHFAHGKTRNWFGGSSNASTQLLDGMHYRGLLRVARRDGGVRVYAAASCPSRRREGRHRRAPGRAGRRDRAQVRAAAGRQPGPAGQPPGRRRAAVADASAQAGLLRAGAAAVGAGRRRRLVWPAARTRESRRWKPDGDACACWPRSTRWSGTAAASNCSGAGPTASRPTRPHPSASSATTRLPLLWRDQVIGWGNLDMAGLARVDIPHYTRLAGVSSADNRAMIAVSWNLRLSSHGLLLCV
jgi:hypothetical protein